MAIHWDSHACLRLHPQASFAPIDRLRGAGVHFVSINVGMDMNPLSQVMAVIAGFRATINANPDKYILATATADVTKAKDTGKIAVAFDLEGALPLMEQTVMVALYASLGVKQIHFAYNRNNSVADGCHDVSRGLTKLGEQMVHAVNQAGMLMDCSHTGRTCSLDIMRVSAHPVIFSHANPLGLVEHGRNITDLQIKACAATGGVICPSGVSIFLGSDDPNANDLARHVAYVANLVGTQHVGIGLDISFSQAGLSDDPQVNTVDPATPYDPNYWWPSTAGYKRGVTKSEYTPVETWLILDNALQKVGMTSAEAQAVMGGNMMRVAQRVWGA